MALTPVSFKTHLVWGPGHGGHRAGDAADDPGILDHAEAVY